MTGRHDQNFLFPCISFLSDSKALQIVMLPPCHHQALIINPPFFLQCKSLPCPFTGDERRADIAAGILTVIL